MANFVGKGNFKLSQAIGGVLIRQCVYYTELGTIQITSDVFNLL